LFGISGVAAAVMSVAVYVAYGAKRGLWASGAIRPTPLNSGPILGLAVVALAFFGWQTHVPLTLVLLIEVGLGLLVTALAIWVGRLLKSPTFYIEGTFVKVLWRVGLLLVPALLLWPRQVLLEPEPLAFALAAAGLATLGTHLALTPLLSLYAWLDEAGAEAEEPDQLVNTLLVRDLMTREIVTVPPDTPVPEIARLLSERAIGCVPVVEADGRLVGIVTESDLFVKQERLPRTGRTYPALFKEPITPELLPQVYADLGARHVAADAMDGYVAQLEQEVRKYTGENPNYGKAAKRMYNVFRLSGRYAEAAYLRELFDEPATVLYQIAAVLRSVDEAALPGSAIQSETVVAQLDELIIQVVAALEGQQETGILRRLLNLHALLAKSDSLAAREQEVTEAQNDVMEVVNGFFYERLTALPSIKTYIETLQA